MRIASPVLLVLLSMFVALASSVPAQQLPAPPDPVTPAAPVDHYSVLFELIELDHTALQQAGIELDPALRSSEIQYVDTHKVYEYIRSLETQSAAKRLLNPVLVVQSGELGMLKTACDTASIDLQFRPVVNNGHCDNEFYVDFLTPNGQGSRLARNFAFSYSAQLGQTLLACSDKALIGNDKTKTHFVLLTVNRTEDPQPAQAQVTDQVQIAQAATAQTPSDQGQTDQTPVDPVQPDPLPVDPVRAIPVSTKVLLANDLYRASVQVVEIDLEVARTSGIELAEPKSYPSKSLGKEEAKRFHTVLESLERAGIAQTIFAPQLAVRSGETGVATDNDGGTLREVRVLPNASEDWLTTDIHIKVEQPKNSPGLLITNDFSCTTKSGQTFLYRKATSGSPTAKTYWIVVRIDAPGKDDTADNRVSVSP